MEEWRECGGKERGREREVVTGYRLQAEDHTAFNDDTHAKFMFSRTYIPDAISDMPLRWKRWG